MEFVMVHQLINPETGNTYKEDNLKIVHKIPIGTLVECKFDTWHRGGACEKNHVRLWVVRHSRDCDGTPLYSISRWKGTWPEMEPFGGTHHNFPEYMLTPIKVTKELEDGHGALCWDEEVVGDD